MMDRNCSYEASWGWSDKGKRSELKESNALFLLAYVVDPETKTRQSQPIAFSHFRFDYEALKKTNELYMYEIHLEEAWRGQGLGKFMMQTLEFLGIKFGMDYLMMTVFKANDKAMHFYMDNLKYKIDSTSPSKNLEFEEPHELLSKPLKANLK